MFYLGFFDFLTFFLDPKGSRRGEKGWKNEKIGVPTTGYVSTREYKQKFYLDFFDVFTFFSRPKR